MIEQDFDLRFVTRVSTGTEVVAEYRVQASTPTLPAPRVEYRILGTDETFGIGDVASERKAPVECPCTSCAQRRGSEIRMRIAADAVRQNPMSPPIVTDGVAISNAVRSKSENAAADQVLHHLLGHLRRLVTDADAAVTAYNLKARP